MKTSKFYFVFMVVFFHTTVFYSVDNAIEVLPQVSSPSKLTTVAIPNGTLKNPKLPRSFPITDDTIFEVTPLPADEVGVKTVNSNTENQLILIPQTDSKLNSTSSVTSNNVDVVSSTNQNQNTDLNIENSTKIVTPSTEVVSPTIIKSQTSSISPSVKTPTSENSSDTTKITNTPSITLQKENTTDTTQQSSQKKEIDSNKAFFDEPEIESMVDSSVVVVGEQAPMTITRRGNVNYNQFLDIVMNGRGWIFLGEVEPTGSIVYSNRKFNNNDTVFVFHVLKPGVSILHFYKQDIISSSWIDEYFEITISNQKAVDSKEHTVIYEIDQNISNISNNIADLNSSDNKNSETASLSQSQNTDQNITLADVNILVNDAKKAYEIKDFITAVEKLTQLENIENAIDDSVLFLIGNVYEAVSDFQNVQKAYNAYDQIVTNYPYSSNWNAANERKRYIDRFYLSIQ